MVTKENQFFVLDNACPELRNSKIGQTFKGLINYQVVEETKSYTMIKVKYFKPDYGKRVM